MAEDNVFNGNIGAYLQVQESVEHLIHTTEGAHKTSQWKVQARNI